MASSRATGGTGAEHAQAACALRDPPDLEDTPLPESAQGERLLALGSQPRTLAPPMVLLDRARVAPESADLDALESWARQHRRWCTLVEVLALRARRATDAARVELYREASRIASERLFRFDLALTCAEAARGPRARGPLLAELAGLYERASRPTEAAGCLELLVSDGSIARQHSGGEGEPLDAVAVAQIFGRLARQGDGPFQVLALRRAVGLDPGSTSLREELIAALAAHRDRWPAHSTALPPSDVERANELTELALASALEDPRTVDRLRRAVDMRRAAGQPDDPDLREALHRALLATGQFGELERALRDDIRRASPAHRAARLCALGALAAGPPWSRLDLAREAYQLALRCPGSDPDRHASPDGTDPATAFDWLAEDARLRQDLPAIDRLVARRLQDLVTPAARNAVRHRGLSVALALATPAEAPCGRAMQHAHLATPAEVADTPIVETLRAILFEDPDDRRALEAAAVLVQGAAWRDGIKVLLAAADAPSGQGVRARVLAACLRIASERGAGPEILLPLHERLARPSPEAPGRRQELADARARAGADDRALSQAAARADSASSDALRAQALHALGTLHVDRWELDLAWTAFERVLAIDPTEPDALRALETIAREPGYADRLEAVLRRRLVSLEAGRDLAADHRRVLHEVAALTADEDEAVLLLSRVLELDPSDGGAIDEIHWILARRLDHYALAVHLDRHCATGDPIADRGRRKRLARLLSDELGESAAAALRWEEVLEADPSDREGLEELAALGEAMGQPARASEILERLARGLEDGPRRTEVLRRIARLEPEPDARTSAYRRLLEAAPGDVEAVRHLAQAYGPGDAKQELAIRLARATSDPSEKAATLLRVARGQSAREAMATLDAVLAIEPANEAALGERAEAARQTGQWRVLIECQERLLLRARDPADVLALSIAIAAVWSEQCGDQEAAARSLERARRIDPSSHRIARQLEVLHERIEDWPALARSLRLRLDPSASPAERLEATIALARLTSLHLDAPDMARDLHAQAAALAPGRADLAGSATDAMAVAGAWEPLVEHLRRQATGTTDTAERAALQHTICVLHDRALHRPQAAFDDAVLLARTLGPTPASLRLLEHHAMRAGRHQDLVTVLDELSARSADPRAGCLALDRAARVLEESLAAPAAALDRRLEILRRIGAAPRQAAAIERLALAEGRVSDWVTAEIERERLTDNSAERVVLLERLTRVLSSVGRAEEAFAMALRALAIDPDRRSAADAAWTIALDLDGADAAASQAHRRALAEVHMKVGAAGAWHLARAAELYEMTGDREAFEATAALAIATPADPLPRERLVRLAEAGRRWTELLAVYDELAALVATPAERRVIRFAQACLLQDRLEREAPARSLLQDLMLEDPSWPGLATRALAAARASGQGAVMAAALEDALERMPATQASAVLAFLAELYAVVLDGPADVRRVCEELRALDPGNARAEELLIASYSREGMWEPLAALLWERCGPSSGPQASGREAAQVAEIRAGRLGDLAGALVAYRRAIDLDPHELACLSSYSAALERVGEWQELARILGFLVAELPPGLAQVDPLVRRAQVLSDRLGRMDLAIGCLEQALGLGGYSPRVVHELERLYELSGRVSELLLLRTEAADESEDPEEARALLRRLADLCLEHGDLEGGRAALERAIAVTPDYVPTYGRLREVLERQRDHAGLVELLSREAGVWTDQSESADRLCEAAEVCRDHLGDRARARALFSDAFSLTDRCRRAAQALARDAEERGDAEEAISWLEETRRSTFAPDELLDLDRRIARLTARVRTRIVK